jgi:16S rRNA (uracil1498-N3)-methyltransferase
VHTPRVVISFSNSKFENEARVFGTGASSHTGPSQYLDRTICLESKDYHHLANVLKLSVGESFYIFDRDSCRDFSAEVTSIDKKQLHAKLVAISKQNKTFPITAIVGAPKPSICDEVVEKCVELGTPHIVFFCADRTQNRPAANVLQNRVKRFQRIVEAALKQSGPLGIWPEISFYQDLSSCLKAIHPDGTQNTAATKRFVFTADGYDCKPGQTPLITEYFYPKSTSKNNFSSYSEGLENTEEIADFNIVIGPEGGLSEEELRLVATYRYRACSLGERVLRTHTALVAAVSFIKLTTLGLKQL